jgi:hypothetical protein
MSVDRRSQDLVVEDQGGAASLGSGLPAARRPLDIGEKNVTVPDGSPTPRRRAYAPLGRLNAPKRRVANARSDRPARRNERLGTEEVVVPD